MKRILASLLIISLFLLGVSILYFHKEIIDYWEENFGEQDSRQVIAKVETTSGSPRFKLPQRLVYRDLREGQSLRYYDTITTDENSHARIHFINGLVLDLEPNSMLILEEAQDGEIGSVVISFLQGNFNIVQEGRAGSVLLSRENQTIDTAGRRTEAPVIIRSEEAVLADLDLGEMEEPEVVATPTPTPTPVPVVIATPTPRPSPPPRPRESLGDDYITSVVRMQRPFLNRCYAQHLRLNPNASGRMDISFTIEPNGDVVNARVLRSSISDPRLQKCTLSVIERMKYRSFNGDAIVVNYPINFE